MHNTHYEFFDAYRVAMGFWGYIKKLNRHRNIKTKKIKTHLKLKHMQLFYRKTPKSLPTYNNVCLFMHGQAIGDGIITSGLISELRKAGKKVFIVAPERVRFLFVDIIGVDGFFHYNKKNANQIAKELKKCNIDLVIDTFDFDHTIMYRLKTLFNLKPKYAIGFDQPEKTIFDVSLQSKDDTHLSERMKDILDFLGIKNSSYHYSLSFTNAIFDPAHKYANSIKENKKLIIFNPFGSQKIRSFSIEQVNRILSYLNTLKGFKTIVFDMGENISCNDFDNVILNPFNDAGKSFALASNADVIITVDTAMVHLASALGINQYCIYNNRIHNMKQDNNILFGPNDINARQLTTSEYVNTEEGDNMYNFDVSILITAMDDDLKAGLL